MPAFSSRFFRLAAVAVVLVNGFFPVAWIVATSLKTDAELVRRPITWWPAAPTLANYVRAFGEQPLLRFLGNSLGISALSSLLAVAVAAAAAYAFVRLPVPHRGLWLTGLIAVAMCPAASLLAPLFEIMRGLGLLNTWAALILPNAVFSLPVCTLVLVAYFRSVPAELEEAALIDGCSRTGALWRISLPLAVPGLATVALLAFVNAWDEFLLALTLNAAPGNRTLPVGILLYQGEYTFPWPVISAALVVGIVPLALLIVVFQERVVGGLSAGGLKG
jgi:multiple sugar transport system permease protein